jgi:ornithine carbamoyltransferase
MTTNPTRHFLEVDDLTADELVTVLDLAEDPDPPQLLAGAGAALLFEKPSARTRNSMEMVGLGGHPVTIRPDEVGLDVRESTEDVARTLACYHAVIGARVFDHTKLERMAAVVDVPIVNMLSDVSHPLQALADLLTIRAEFGNTMAGRTVVYVGDANNVARSLGIACAMAGMRFAVASPEGYRFGDDDLARLAAAGAEPAVFGDPREATVGADVVYTDVWTSMGQEDEKAARLAAFADFTIDDAMLDAAADDAIFLHCLPAHPGEECTRSVLDGPASRIWPQAANRMHAARGLVAFVLGAR